MSRSARWAALAIPATLAAITAAIPLRVTAAVLPVSSRFFRTRPGSR
jgi:hypothetical protein